ncbi:MAG TPA: PIN domain-containing protein [Egibacteraceae bacterium]|nr:PIN domain-containing protein [Egibacteraceae bacterium]
MRLRSTTSGIALVETIRLAVVVLATGGAYRLSLATGDGSEDLLLVLLGAAVGYVIGGVIGRFAVGRIDAAERRLRSVPAHSLLAGAIGALVGMVMAGAVTWPILVFGANVYTVPIALLVLVVLTIVGIRVGVSRGGDLLRSLGATGRLPVSTFSGGHRAKVVDTSVLIDGRLVDVCRSGFLEGPLIVPQFVLYELQGLADAGDPERRSRGRRGLDVLTSLQRSSGVALEVTDVDYPAIDAVDAKLVAMAKDRGAGLLTVDGNLGRVAEVQGVTVLNLHTLADHLRPPVIPGDRLEVRVLKPGREKDQGVGYLADGTMVVIEGARGREGSQVTAEVTSILNNPQGRMVFATVVRPDEPTRLQPRITA